MDLDMEHSEKCDVENKTEEVIISSDVLNDTIAAALKLAGFTTVDSVEQQPQVVRIEAGTETVLEVSSTVDEAGVATETLRTHVIPVESTSDSILEVDERLLKETCSIIPEVCIDQTQDVVVEDTILEVPTSAEIELENEIQDTVIFIVSQGVEEPENGGTVDASIDDNYLTNSKSIEEKAIQDKTTVQLDKYLCKYCGKICTDDKNLKSHAALHFIQKDKEKLTRCLFECQKCKKSFQSKWLRENHSCISKRFICEYCGAGYGRKGDMERHIAGVHTDSKPFQCKSCDKLFATKWHLAHHEQVHSSGFQCQICGRRYSQKSHLDRHKIVHSEDSVKCIDCHRWFVNNSELTLHKCNGIKQQKLRFHCHLCEKTFTRKNDLKRHQFLHTGNKPFPCSYCCGKAFVTNWQRKHHERSHTGEKPYHCHCGKQYTQKSHLDNHKIVHASQVFRCTYCKKRFSEKKGLEQHENTHIEKNSQMTNVNVDSGLDTALECLLGFAKETDKTSAKNIDIVPIPNTNVCNSSGESDHVPFVSDNDILSQSKNSNKGQYNNENCFGIITDKATNILLTQSENTEKNNLTNNKHTCKYCHRVYKFRASLLKHYMTHTAFHFDTDNNIITHKESEYLDADDRKIDFFTCLGCNRTYSNEQSCKEHKLNCKSLTETEQSELYKQLIEDEDLGGEISEQVWICKECKKVFPNKNNFQKHMLFHKRCSFTNIFVKSGNAPVKVLDQKLIFVCSYCSKEFAYKTSFHRHEYQHQIYIGKIDNPRPVHLHVCSWCGKDFRRTTHLKRHMLLHKEHDATKKMSVTVQDELNEQSEYMALSEICTTICRTTQLQNVDGGHSSEKDDLILNQCRNEFDEMQGSLENGVDSKCTDNFSTKEQSTVLSQEIKTKKIDSDAAVSTNYLSEEKKSNNLKRTNSRPVRIKSIPIRFRSDTENLQNDGKVSVNLTETSEKSLVVGKSVNCQNKPATVLQSQITNRSSNTLEQLAGISHVMKRSKRKEKEIFKQVNSNNHLQNEHKPFQCKRCKKEFRLKSWLSRHIKHDPSRPLMCRICCRRFSVLESLKRHEAGHTGNYLLYCEVCGKGFNNQPTLEIHMHKHTGKKSHMCDVCGKMFTTKYNLKAHSYIHSGDSPNVCQFCGKHYGRKNDLRRHVLTHEGSQPFSCSFCDRKFVNRWHLRYHEKSHAKKKT